MKSKNPRVQWDETEWDKLAELVYAMRRNCSDGISSMANRAQKQFPKDRQRPGILTVAALQPLVERIQKMDRDLQMKAEKFEEYAAKLSFFENIPSTREELLTTLTDEEIHQHFFPRLLQMLTPDDIISTFPAEQLLSSITTGDIAAIVAKRLVEQLERPVHVTVQMPEQYSRTVAVQRPKLNGNGRQKRIVVIGAKGDEVRHVRDRVGQLCDLTFIETNKLRTENVPRNVDKIIIWSKFISHKQQGMVRSVVDPGKIFEHFFGTKELIKKIENLCRGEPVVVG